MLIGMSLGWLIGKIFLMLFTGNKKISLLPGIICWIVSTLVVVYIAISTNAIEANGPIAGSFSMFFFFTITKFSNNDEKADD